MGPTIALTMCTLLMEQKKLALSFLTVARPEVALHALERLLVEPSTKVTKVSLTKTKLLWNEIDPGTCDTRGTGKSQRPRIGKKPTDLRMFCGLSRRLQNLQKA